MIQVHWRFATTLAQCDNNMALWTVCYNLYKHNISIHSLKTDAFVVDTQNPDKQKNCWHGRIGGQQIRKVYFVNQPKKVVDNEWVKTPICEQHVEV